MTQTEALKLALEALEDRTSLMKWQIARDAVKEALSSPNGEAQPEQRSVSEHLEPVATLDDLEQEIYENTRQFVSRDVMEWMLKRYYTTPPQRTWVGLTDEEINTAASVQSWKPFAKAIEAKLKEKNTDA